MPGESQPAGSAGVTADVVRAFDEAPVALATMTGPDHRLLACNAAYRRLLGAPSDPVGRRPVDLLPPRSARRLTAVLDDVRGSGRPVVVRSWTRPAASGTPPARFDVRVTPAGDRLVLSVDDVTDRDGSGTVGPVDGTGDGTGDGHHDLPDLPDLLLPRALPVLPGLDTAAGSLLADPARPRGDWFDCVVRPDGSVALVVGDVAGTGASATAAMGRLRAVLHAALLDDGPLADVLRTVDRYAATSLETTGASVCVVVVDRVTGALEYATAGHPPPLVLTAGAATSLEPSGGGPLGTGHAAVVARGRLGVRDLVLLLTDGLLERAAAHPDQAVTALLASAARLAAAPAGAPDGSRAAVRTTRGLLEQVARHGVSDDDAVVLAARRVAVTAPLDVERPATGAGRAALAHAVSAWVRDLEVSPLDAVAVEHALGELVGNAVTHAYRDTDTPGPVAVRLDVGADGLLVGTVTDRGRWRPAESAGHGLAVVRALTASTDLRRGPDGTRVVVTLPLTRPAPVLAVPGPHPDGRPDRRRARLVTATVGRCLVVSGSVDAGDADRFRTELFHHAPVPGAVDRVVDLSEVTHLDGTGVQALHEVTARCPGLRLRARAGSVAQQVLDVVRLPHD